MSPVNEDPDDDEHSSDDEILLSDEDDVNPCADYCDDDFESIESDVKDRIDTIKLCRDLIALKMDKGLTQASIDGVLNLINTNFGKRLGGFADFIPNTYAAVEKLANSVGKDDVVDTEFAECRFVDVCPGNNCVLFREEDKTETLTYCPVCKAPRYDPKYPDTKKAKLQVAYWSLSKWIKNLYSIPAAAKSLKYAYYRKSEAGVIKDILDGSLWKHKFMKQFTPENPFTPSHLAFTLCCDGTPIQALKGISLTPVLITVVNLPPWVRFKFGAIFMAALLPPHVKNYNTLLRPVIEDILLMYTRIPVYDADIKKNVNVFGYLLFTINDYPGMGSTNMQRLRACYGACHSCNVKGIMCNGTMIFPGHVSYLPKNHELREAHREEFSEEIVFAELSYSDRPLSQTKVFAIAEGNNYINEKQSCYKGVDILTELLPYWDKIQQSINDAFHEVGHAIYNLFLEINPQKHKYDLAYEVYNLDRFSYTYQGKGCKFSLPDFVVKKSIRSKVNDVFGKLKIPLGSCSKLPLPFNQSGWKTIEKLLLVGDIGVYIISLCNFDDKYESVFFDYIRALEPLLYKVTRKTKMEINRKKLDVALAKYEINMPIHFNQITRHILHHFLGNNGMYSRTGGYLGTTMSPHERWNKFIRGLAPKSVNALKSIALAYSNVEKVNHWRSKNLLGSDLLGSMVMKWNEVMEVPGVYDKGKMDIVYNLNARGHSVKGSLCDEDMLFVYALWAQYDKTYDTLLKKYNLYKNNNNVDISLHDYGKISRQRPLSHEQQIICDKQTTDVIYIDSVKFNSSTFRPSKKNNATENCYIKAIAREEGTHEILIYYGKITSMFVHEKYIGSNEMVILKVYWYEMLFKDKITKFTVLRDTPNYELNDNFPFVVLQQIESQNLSIWPYDHRYTDEENPTYKHYCVIDRKNQYCYDIEN